MAKFFKRWVDLCFWWLPKTKGEGASDANRSHAVAKSVSTDVKPVERKADDYPGETDADDLTVIKGIGSATQKKLNRFGITTLADLAASDPETLIANLGASQPISPGRVSRWIKAAQDRTGRKP